MRPTETVIFVNMCMIYDNNGNVVVQNRVKKDWSGTAFPGGHVEKGESFTLSVIREILEETGLTITHPQLCGIKNWFKNDMRYVVLCYKTNLFSGELTSSIEGVVSWMSLEDFKKSNLADNMDKMLELFINDDISEFSFWVENGEPMERLI